MDVTWNRTASVFRIFWVRGPYYIDVLGKVKQVHYEYNEVFHAVAQEDIRVHLQGDAGQWLLLFDYRPDCTFCSNIRHIGFEWLE
jgi:hypothetical protein